MKLEPKKEDMHEWSDWLDEALPVANIPTLLMVLVHLSGDSAHWLQPRYQCARVPGIDDFDSGGLSDDVQQEVRDAARQAILDWKHGRPIQLNRPDPELLRQMLRINVGEAIPEGYGEIIAADFGLDPAFDLKQAFPGLGADSGFKVVIVGAGVSGICTAIRLQRAGVPYVVLEKNHELTGTWYENHYPGCGVDTPSHIYSYSFAKHDWSMFFALQGEIKDYFEQVADRYGVREHIRFGAKVLDAAFDDDRGIWRTRFTQNGNEELLESNVLISAVGYLNTPKVANIEGLSSFKGECFHTARWPKDLDLSGRDVAIIGNGATAMQIVPEIAPKVRSLSIFQRSKQWAAPFPQFRRQIPASLRRLIQQVPYYQAWYRQRLAWIFNDRIHASLQIDPQWPHADRSINAHNDKHREFFTAYIKQELGDRQDLLPEVLPDFPPFGKRMLLDNGWYRTLRRDNVRLINGEVVRIEGNTVHASGGESVQADLLIVSTGFDAANVLSSFEIRGRDGITVQQAWAETGPEAYMGVSLPGFPNLFVVAGPNTGFGHGGSIVASLEWQVRHVLGLIEEAGRLHGNRFVVEVQRDVCAEYNARVQSAHQQMIWSHRGMTTYYRNGTGRVVGVTPFRNSETWHMRRKASLQEYHVRVAEGCPQTE